MASLWHAEISLLSAALPPPPKIQGVTANGISCSVLVMQLKLLQASQKMDVDAAEGSIGFYVICYHQYH